MRPRGGGERRAERRARTAEKEKEEEEGEEGGRRRGGEGKGVHTHTHIHIERWKDTTMKEEESAFARPHTLEKLQHTDDKEESRVERRKSAREERESKRVGARGGTEGRRPERVRGTEFILRAFFYRSLTPRCSAAAVARAARCALR